MKGALVIPLAAPPTMTAVYLVVWEDGAGQIRDLGVYSVASPEPGAEHVGLRPSVILAVRTEGNVQAAQRVLVQTIREKPELFWLRALLVRVLATGKVGAS